MHTHRALLEAYPNLKDAELSRQAMVATEDALFQYIYIIIFPLYQTLHLERDQRFASKASELRACPPSFYGVSEKFWLLPQAGEDLEPEVTPPPYDAAIRVFEQFSAAESPANKARAIGTGERKNRGGGLWRVGLTSDGVVGTATRHSGHDARSVQVRRHVLVGARRRCHDHLAHSVRMVLIGTGAGRAGL